MATETQDTATISSELPGDVSWTNPTNAATSNDKRATCALASGQTSERLAFRDFGFTTVTGTVNGFEVSIERRCTAGEIVDSGVYLSKDGGSTLSNNKADATPWGIADAAQAYGGAADLWGLTISAAEVTATDFTLILIANYPGGIADTAEVDYASVTVHFTASTPSAPGGVETRRRKVQHLLGR